jgi:HTH-type transcriptional regulator / antitoxin HigA
MLITNELELKAAFAHLDTIIAEGFEGNAEKEDLFLGLAKAIEAYEDNIPLMPIKAPQTLQEMIELKMYQLKLKQKDLASLLEISPTRLSEVLSGKRKVNLDLAKRLYQRLQIDAEFILKTA